MGLEELSRAGYLRAIRLQRDRVPSFDRHPFSVPAVRNLDELELDPRVTYLIGENGSGKSTLLEAIAVAWGFNPEGGTRNFNFGTVATHSELHRYLQLVRGPRRARDGFFFRAETYYNLASEMDRLDAEPGAGPPIVGSYGGRSLHEQSHGESFFAALLNRFGGRGLYLFDEPEAALSPKRQLAFLVAIHRLVSEDSQFIIATHSPVVLAYPDATILELGEDGIQRVKYTDTDHYNVTLAFLQRREQMLKSMFWPEDAGGGGPCDAV